MLLCLCATIFRSSGLLCVRMQTGLSRAFKEALCARFVYINGSLANKLESTKVQNIYQALCSMAATARNIAIAVTDTITVGLSSMPLNKMNGETGDSNRACRWQSTPERPRLNINELPNPQHQKQTFSEICTPVVEGNRVERQKQIRYTAVTTLCKTRRRYICTFAGTILLTRVMGFVKVTVQ